jgi:hypothetical protein
MYEFWGTQINLLYLDLAYTAIEDDFLWFNTKMVLSKLGVKIPSLCKNKWLNFSGLS